MAGSHGDDQAVEGGRVHTCSNATHSVSQTSSHIDHRLLELLRLALHTQLLLDLRAVVALMN